MDTLNVLVVDDEMGMRLGVARALGDYAVAVPDINGQVRFNVAQAETAEQARDMIEQARPDILLLDYKLPGMSGLDLLQAIASKEEKPLTVMITAYASLETAVTAIKRGAYDFLAKPFTPNELKNTVRKAAEHLILQQQARRLAEEKRQVRFQFISVLAHELKAPLGAIEGYLRIVRDKAAGNDQAVYDNMLERSIVRLDGMRKLIVDLLDLTRIESGKKQRELLDLNLTEIARTAIDTATPAAAQRNIAIHLDAPDPLPMKADRGEIEIILNNLVSNAVKYNKDGGRVDVCLQPRDDRVAIAVSDTGIGMTHEEADRLFQDFVRIKNEKTRNILGSGLGLSIVRKLASFYGGQVAVASRPDEGSTFTVTLNRQPQTKDENDGPKRNNQLAPRDE